MVVRLFIGGLPRDISEADLCSRFSPFGKVGTVDIIPPQINLSQLSDDQSGKGTCRGFAYVELDPKDDGSVHKCLSVYNNSKWRGNVLRVELAKPSYLAKLQVDWLEQAQQSEQPATKQEGFVRLAAPSAPAVSEASLAAASAAAAAAAAKRAKAAERSSRPYGPVPPPVPADLSKPLNLLNPHSRRQPLVVDLLHPSKPPRRSFPSVAPLPLSRLEWQRHDDFGEYALGGDHDDGSTSDSEAGADTGGGPVADRRRSVSAVVAVAARPSRCSRSGDSAGNAAAMPPSVLYYLNRVLSLPMQRLASAAGRVSAGGGWDPSADRDDALYEVQPQEQHQQHAISSPGAAIPPPENVALQRSDLGRASSMAEEGAKRAVHGEMLSMYKVIKAIDSESRKRNAEEEAERLTKAKVAEARGGGFGGGGPAGVRSAPQRQQPRRALSSAPLQPPDAAASRDGAAEAEAGGVVDFMEEDDLEGPGNCIHGGEQQHQQQQQLLLDRFADSDDDSLQRQGGSRAPVAVGMSGGGRSHAAGAARVAAVSGVQQPSVPRAAGQAEGGLLKERGGRKAAPGTAAAAAAMNPHMSVRTNSVPPEGGGGRVVAASGRSGPRASPVSLPTDGQAAVAPGGTRPSKRARSGSDGDVGGASGPAGGQSRGGGGPEVPLVPLGPPQGRSAGAHRGGGAKSSSSAEMLERFGGSSDSDGEEAFRDVDDSDSEPEARLDGRCKGSGLAGVKRKAEEEMHVADTLAPAGGDRMAAARSAAVNGAVRKIAAAPRGPGSPAVVAVEPVKRTDMRRSSRAVGGPSESPDGIQPRIVGSTDMRLVPGGPQGGTPRNEPGGAGGGGSRGGAVMGRFAVDPLDRFGGGSDSDGEEVFRDVDDSDAEPESRQRRKGLSLLQNRQPPARVAAAQPRRPQSGPGAVTASHGPVVSFLDGGEQGIGTRADRGAAGPGQASYFGGTDSGRGQAQPRTGSADPPARGAGLRSQMSKPRSSLAAHTATPGGSEADATVITGNARYQPNSTPAGGAGGRGGVSSGAAAGVHGHGAAGQLQGDGAQGRRVSAPAPHSATPAAAALLASTFVRPRGSSDDQLAADWASSFGGLMEGARESAKSTMRAMAGRAPRRGAASRR